METGAVFASTTFQNVFGQSQYDFGKGHQIVGSFVSASPNRFCFLELCISTLNSFFFLKINHSGAWIGNDLRLNRFACRNL